MSEHTVYLLPSEKSNMLSLYGTEASKYLRHSDLKSGLNKLETSTDGWSLPVSCHNWHLNILRKDLWLNKQHGWQLTRVDTGGQSQQAPYTTRGSRRTRVGARAFLADAAGLVWEMTEQTRTRVASPYWHQSFVPANPLQRATVKQPAPHSHQ